MTVVKLSNYGFGSLEYMMRIKDISLNNRPIERLEKMGVSVLSDSELLSIILKTGNKGENVIDLSNRLISIYGLERLSGRSLKELQQIKGIGKAKSSQILAIFELSKRYYISKQDGITIRSAKDVYGYCHPRLKGLDKEHLLILHLDTKNRIIKDEIISIGTLNSSLIHPREVFKSAIRQSANSIIVVHNHPSGNAEPSDQDEKITDILFKAGKLLSINVLDHVIIGDSVYYSFNEERS